MDWTQKFKVKQTVTDSSYNQKVAGASSTLKAGKHDVTLAAVVAADGYHAYDLTWENDEGTTFRDRVWVTYETKDKDGRNTGELDIADNFVRLGVALSGGDNTLNQSFFLEESSGAYINPERMKAAVGTKATIVIGLPRKGLTVKNTDSGAMIFDIEANEPVKGIPAFAEFTELKEYAKEHNLKLSYNKVLSYRLFKDAATSNRQQIQAALDADKPKAKASPKTQGF